MENYAIKKDDTKKDIDEVNLQLKLLKQKKASLVLEQKSINVNITKLEAEKESVQSDIEKETTKSKMIETQIKNEVDKLEDNIKSVQMKIKDTKDCKEPENQNSNMVKFLDNSIETKKKVLECPVCFEVAKVPIFSCSESHLVCQTCRPKLKQCPECRVEYNGEKKRHRYAEMIATELDTLLKERETLLSKLE